MTIGGQRLTLAGGNVAGGKVREFSGGTGAAMNNVPTIVAVILTLGASTSVSASSVFVAADGSGDVPTIQDAINTSADGDTVLLGDGIFDGPGNRDMYVNDNGLVIRSVSDNPAVCIVDCGGDGAQEHWGFLWDKGGGSSVIQGLSIRNGNTTGIYIGFGSAVYVRGTHSVTMKNCWVYANRGIAIRFLSPQVGILEQCAVFGNYNPWSSGSAGVSVGVSGQIVSCTIAGNRGRVGGISVGLAALLDIYNSVIWGNCATLGGQYDQIFANDGVVQIHCSVVDSSGIGSFEPGHVLYDTNNEYTNPYFCDPASCEEAPTDTGDYHVDAISPCLPANNSCGAAIGAFGVNCTGATPTLETSWGAIKSQYRK